MLRTVKFMFFWVCAAALFFAVSARGKEIINAHADAKYGKPIPFCKVAGTAGTMALEIFGGKLYALEDGGLSIFDISVPRSPVRLGHIGGMGNVRQLQVRGKTAFLSSRQCGLWAVDVSDCINPKIISNFDGVEMATGLDVAGDVAFLGNRVYGIQCVDVSDPAEMKNLSSLRTDESQSVMYRDGLLFSGDWAGGEITVIDVANVLEPKPISMIKLDGYGDGVCLRSNILFASTGQHKKSGPSEKRYGAGHGLDLFDISDPLKPVKLSRVEFPQIYFGPCDYWTPRACGNWCFAADTVNGLFLVDVSDLRNPKIAGNLILPKTDPENPKTGIPYTQISDPKIPQGDPISSIAIGDGVLYISGTFTGIYCADLPKSANIAQRDFGALPKLPSKHFDGREKGFYTSGAELSNPTRAVAIIGDTAYTANVWNGVKVYRLSDDGLKQVGRLDIAYAADVRCAGDRLYVAEGQNGIGAYKVLSDAKVEEIGRLKVLDKGLNFVQFLWAFDGCNIVAATCAGTKVYFVDFTNPAEPKVVFSMSGTGLLYGNYAAQNLVNNRYLLLSRTFGGLQVFDVKEKTPKMIWSDTYPLCSQTGTAAALGDEFIVMCGGGYAFLNPETPAPTRDLKKRAFPAQGALPPTIPDASAISRAQFPKTLFEGLANANVESKLAVANRIFKNCRTYDFSDKNNPKALNAYELVSNPNVPAFWHGRVVLPCGYSGLLLEK